jgi:glucose/arabinose dehydrogenase
MSQRHSRRPRLAALSLSAALVLVAGSSIATTGADPSPSTDPGVDPSAPPAASAVATPEPSPYPAFDPSTVKLRTDLFVDGLDAPVYLADDGVLAGDGVTNPCLYVVERAGTVRIVRNDGAILARPFLDLGPNGLDVVVTGPEQGLHAIAFHPRFKQNGLFYVHYNALPDGRTVIAEFKGTRCKPGSRPAKGSLLTVEQEFPNNKGGWIGFGPDGFLYIPMGDGGGASPGDPRGLGQAPDTEKAKVLRIDVDKGRRYQIPADNPYAKKRKGGFLRETWARGLRDPRRASFDRETGDLWIGDVGERIEEVNRIPAGVPDLNFGWSEVEGATTCHPNVPDCEPSRFEPPVYAYDKAPPQRAITGGYVYRGESFPALDGVYLFSDFASGFIWGLDADALAAGQPAVAHLLLDAPQGFVSFGEDDAGELYVLSLDGSVYRISAEAT